MCNVAEIKDIAFYIMNLIAYGISNIMYFFVYKIHELLNNCIKRMYRKYEYWKFIYTYVSFSFFSHFFPLGSILFFQLNFASMNNLEGFIYNRCK